MNDDKQTTFILLYNALKFFFLDLKILIILN